MARIKLDKVVAPIISDDIFDCLNRALICAESEVRMSGEEGASIFKDPERKKLVVVDQVMDPVPLIFTKEEHEKIIQGIYEDVYGGFMAYIYFLTCRDKWIKVIGSHKYDQVLKGYKDAIIYKVKSSLRNVLLTLDIFDNQVAPIASLFLTDPVILDPAVEGFVQTLNCCTENTEVFQIDNDEPESEEK